MPHANLRSGIQDALPGGDCGAAEERSLCSVGRDRSACRRSRLSHFLTTWLHIPGQVTEEQTKLGLENWFDEYNARELRQIWEAKTATYNQLRTMNSKLDDMQNLLNKMRDGMNQVKQGVASVKQRMQQSQSQANVQCQN
ncbi:uncharacterized protein LOC6032498 [Culex quinquefasciatus]|uniref:uncharacterized protein LOC6032498 n=1 Tax=Culex quinquefasciatus TaxID=7176 RepID=UPI0018E3EDC3|nr:uncharacterized protein LOC6032498 [Culex quinquefasciatus]